MKTSFLYIAVLLFFSSALLGQEKNDSLPMLSIPGEEYQFGLFPKSEPPALKSFAVSGFYRFFGTYTDMKSPYLLNSRDSAMTPDRNLFVADDTQLPNLWMNIAGRPSKNMSFNMDLFAFQFLGEKFNDSYGTQVTDSLTPGVYDPLGSVRLGGNLGLNLGINLRGVYNTDIGSFAASMGGTHWYQLSDLTFSSFQGYNRFMLFERNPWDPVERNPTERYDKFVKEGAIQQDLRWGNRAFHGMIFEGTALPENMSFSLLYGRTEQNGGLSNKPNSSFGGRLKRETDRGFISFNTFNSRSYTDSLNNFSTGFNIHTLQVNEKNEDFAFDFEMGAGRYFRDNLDEGFGGAFNFKLRFPNNFLNMPLEIHAFRISPRVVNNNAQFWNTSIPDANATNDVAGSSGVLVPFASSMISIGQMTNNRSGLNLNLEKKVSKDLVLGLGYGFNAEIDGLSNSISYSHTVNQLTRSRFWRWDFNADVGPYDRYSVVYRDAFETVNVIDRNENGDITPKRKHFTNAELQGKYKTRIMNKEMYLLFLGRYSTVQDEFKPILPVDESPYIRMYSSELELYYAITPALIWSNYFGYERVIGNYRTDIDNVSGKPRNQEGVGGGTGFELSIGKNSVFILRHRWFAFQDFSFEADQAKGTESLAEIKVFF